MNTLLSLLKGTQIPGPGNRFWNWASKIATKSDNSPLARAVTAGGVAPFPVYTENCTIALGVDGLTWSLTVPGANFGLHVVEGSLVNPTVNMIISVEEGFATIVGTDGPENVQFQTLNQSLSDPPTPDQYTFQPRITAFSLAVFRGPFVTTNVTVPLGP